MKAKRKDTGEVYALKIMNKRHKIRESKVKFVKMERIILDQLDYPGVASPSRMFTPSVMNNSCTLFRV